MTRLFKASAIALVLTFAFSAAGVAATTKKSTKKPAAKAPAKTPAAPAAPAQPTAPATTPHYVQGTTQMKGEYANFNEPYTLSKEFPMNVVLKSAEYSVDTLVIGNHTYYPKADEKMLVLHYVLQNPQPQERYVNWDYFGITAVDAASTNYEFIQDVGQETSKVSLDMSLKPSQPVDAFTAIMVPAKGEIPKVIFKSGDDLVLRYDFKGKAKPLAAPFADPKDSTGFTALAKVPAKLDTFYPLGVFSVKVDKAEFVNKSLGSKYELEDGNRFMVVSATIKNVSPETKVLNWDTFNVELRDPDGNDIEWVQDMLQNSRNASVEVDMEPGQEIKVRFPFTVASDQQAQKFAITWEECRKYEFDVSAVK